MSASSRRFTAALVGLVALILGAAAFSGSALAAPYVNAATVSVSNQNPSEGGSLGVTCAGFTGGEQVGITLGAQTDLASGTADASGSFNTTVTLPQGVTGQHTIVCAGAAGETASLTITIGAATTGGGGGLSNTGVAVVGIGALGLALLAGGGAMLLAGKRRKVSA
jgi:hypothetical protein